MNKVCFLIVLGIGVPKVGENLSVRIFWVVLNRQGMLSRELTKGLICSLY